MLSDADVSTEHSDLISINNAKKKIFAGHVESTGNVRNLKVTDILGTYA
jgi:hypothetical protein